MFSQQEKLLFLQVWCGQNGLNYAKNRITGDVMFFERHQVPYLKYLLPAEFEPDAWVTYHRVPGFEQIGDHKPYDNKTVGAVKFIRGVRIREFRVLRPRDATIYQPS